MVQGVSFSNFGVNFGQNVQKKQGNPGQPPQDFLDKLKNAGIPDNIVSQGKDAVDSYAKANNISLPQPPELPTGGPKELGQPPAGSKSQGAAHANQNSALLKSTSDEIKTVMDENGIVSSGTLKDDLAAIKSTIKSLDDDAAKILKEKFQALGLDVAEPDKTKEFKDSFKGSDNLASLNKHLLVKHKSAKAAV